MVKFSEKEKSIIEQLNHPCYTVEFLEQWVNRNDNPLVNSMAALQAMGAKGYYEAVKQVAACQHSLDICKDLDKAAPSKESHCSLCNCNLAWEDPDVPGRLLISSDYEPGFDLCHTCLVEHCMQTNCLQCDLRKYPECEFLKNKELYLEEDKNES